MRYEKMTEEQQEAMLARLYRRLNKRLFNNELNPLPIWVVDKIDWTDDGEAWAAFSAEKQRFYFSSILNDDLSTMKKDDQLWFLASLLTHEMTHQYCWENGIDDSNHNAAFWEELEKRGLKRELIDGEWRQKPSLLIWYAVYTFKF